MNESKHQSPDNKILHKKKIISCTIAIMITLGAIVGVTLQFNKTLDQRDLAISERDQANAELSDVKQRQQVTDNIITMVRNFNGPYITETDSIKVFTAGTYNRVVCATFKATFTPENKLATIDEGEPEPAVLFTYPQEYRKDTAYYTVDQSNNTVSDTFYITQKDLEHKAGVNCYLVKPFVANAERQATVQPWDYTEKKDICGVEYYYSEDRVFQAIGDSSGSDRIVTGNDSQFTTSNSRATDMKVLDKNCKELAESSLKKGQNVTLYFPRINNDGSGFFVKVIQLR